MAGLSPSALTELVKEPFGPYWEDAALTKKVAGTTVKNPLVLKCLILGSGGVYTGLSECDNTMYDYDGQRFVRDPVHFTGILEIRHLSWLTPEVTKEIETELKNRDVRARRSANNPRPQPSNCTLKSLYAPSPGFRRGKYKIKVKIESYMHFAASHLLSRGVPNGLRITSALAVPDTPSHRRRSYAVGSMDVRTYALSRLYLARWTVHRVMRDIVELEHNSIPDEEWTPPEDRTPDWYIDGYFKYFAYDSSGRQLRVVSAESDSDIDPETGGRMIRGREHALRHVSRAEVSSILAEHIEWLIHQTYTLDSSKTYSQLFDPDKWRKQWLPDIRRTRQQAAAIGRSWGVWQGYEVPSEYTMEIDEIRWPESSRRREKVAKKSRKPASRLNATTWSAQPPREDDDEDGMDVDESFFNPTTQRKYDSDFSVSSSDNEAPPTSDEEGDVSVGLADPEVIALIPPSFRHLPPRPVSLKWNCTECDYAIDLLNLTQYDLDNSEIPHRTRDRLRSKRWNIFRQEDEWVYKAFIHMVDKHHAEHLEERGVAFRRVPGGWTAVWKDGRPSHSSSLRQVKVDARRQKDTVKAEDL
ncbi:hypothetical protein K466DRAFT_580894 [Polyporus arcularius HHB13444]|uniref:Uncharacterized protein n=1 Tax=Polyporus arcularius HHB13444 TaxID=1314778 RepID=A0A5C3PUT8_9APHY|nr:hypothetical protein K466DRAFT_580894 [Polyporus arcularius HHB13444]